jgi:hypothetical protein
LRAELEEDGEKEGDKAAVEGVGRVRLNRHVALLALLHSGERGVLGFYLLGLVPALALALPLALNRAVLLDRCSPCATVSRRSLVGLAAALPLLALLVRVLLFLVLLAEVLREIDAGLHELLVRARGLDRAVVVENENHVADGQDVEVVRDEEARLARECARNAVLDEVHAHVRVHGGNGVV